MLLALSIFLMLVALGCLEVERRPKLWPLSRPLVALSGFFVGLAFASAAWWAWSL